MEDIRLTCECCKASKKLKTSLLDETVLIWFKLETSEVFTMKSNQLVVVFRVNGHIATKPADPFK